MKKWMMLVTILGGLSAFAGCGGGFSGDFEGLGSGEYAGTCIRDQGSRCTEFTGTAWSQSAVRNACTAPDVYTSERCDGAGSVGSCAIGSDLISQTIFFYGPTTSDEAQRICNAFQGIWRAP